MNERLKALSAIGVSIWLDDLSRERLDTGNLARLVAEQGVTGVTTNPTIFAAAVAKGSWYDAQLAEFTGGDTDVEQAVLELTTTDVRRACDLLYETFVSSGGWTDASPSRSRLGSRSIPRRRCARPSSSGRLWTGPTC